MTVQESSWRFGKIVFWVSIIHLPAEMYACIKNTPVEFYGESIVFSLHSRQDLPLLKYPTLESKLKLVKKKMVGC